MIKTSYGTIEVSFNLPNWFPPDRLDYSNAHHFDKQHAYAGSYNYSSYHNSAEDNIFNRFKDIKEICNYYHITFEYDGTPEQLSNWIKTKEGQLDRFFNRYKEAKE